MSKLYTAALLIVFGVFTAMGRPNVVLVLIDDLGKYGVTAYGSNKISSRQGYFKDVEFETPRMNRLAENGLMCSHAYTYPLCEPTRIALMSGMHNGQNYIQAKALHESQITFGDLFHRAGYKTCIAGKWKQTRGTRETAGKDYIYEFGWDEFCCFDVVSEGNRFLEPNLVINGKIENFAKHPKKTDPQTGRRWYGPDIINRYALDFIDRNQNEPFFLYYPMMLVHDEHQPTPDTQPKSAYDEFDLNKESGFGHGKGDDRRYFPDMIEYTDKMIGRIVDKLAEHNLLENTLIIVMGDNGTKECFEHVMPDGSIYPGGKGMMKHNGANVPLILHQPKTIPVGKGAIRRYDGLVHLTDILPTMCEAAGVSIPHAAYIDGRSLWAQAIGKTEAEHRDVIVGWYNGNTPSKKLDGLLTFAYDKEFKRYAPHKDFPEGRFFDLRTDLFEEVGDRKIKVGYAEVRASGLNIAKLTPEQKAAYDRLGNVIEANRRIPVTGLQIVRPEAPLKAGQSTTLECRIQPANATRQNVIWVSETPEIATIDKFGVLTAQRPGTAKISVYSWDDAYPISDNGEIPYSTNGIQHTITLQTVR